MSDQKKTELESLSCGPYKYDDHPRPTNRRDLLRQGFMSFSAFAMAPTIFGMAASTAHAFECAQPTAENYLPYLAIDCAGGAALPANFLVGKQGGPNDLLASYGTLGWDPRTAPIDSRFGLPMAGNNISQILAGMLSIMSADAQARFRMSSLCHFAQDDSSSNPLSVISLVQQIGYRGLLVPKALGIVDSESGGNSRSAGSLPTLKPLPVKRVSDILNAVSFGRAFNDLRGDPVTNMVKGSVALSEQQIGMIPDTDEGRALKDALLCGYKQNLAYTQSTNGLDPRQNATFQQVYGINANTAVDNEDAVTATVVSNVLNGNAGPGVLTVGGCDYHDGTQTTGDRIDRKIGLYIGRAVEAAHRLKKPLFIHILTDGGCATNPGSRAWRSDSGVRCMSVIGMYDPNGPRQQMRLQVGNFTDGEAADQSTLIGAQPVKVAYAVFANYLKSAGQLNRFEELLPGVFSTAEIDSILAFG